MLCCIFTWITYIEFGTENYYCKKRTDALWIGTTKSLSWNKMLSVAAFNPHTAVKTGDAAESKLTVYNETIIAQQLFSFIPYCFCLTLSTTKCNFLYFAQFFVLLFIIYNLFFNCNLFVIYCSRFFFGTHTTIEKKLREGAVE